MNFSTHIWVYPTISWYKQPEKQNIARMFKDIHRFDISHDTLQNNKHTLIGLYISGYVSKIRKFS